MIPEKTIKVGRFCLDCGYSINDRPNRSIRCVPCQKESARISVNERVKKKYLLKRKYFPTDIIKCMTCGKDMIRGNFSGKFKRCPECKIKSNLDWRKNFDITVAKTCCNCNEIMIIDRKVPFTGKYRDYCEVCRPLHYRRRKFGYKVPNPIKCFKCGIERRPSSVKYIERKPYCAKCAKGVRYLLRKKEWKERLAYNEVVRKQKEIERNSLLCSDCGNPIGPLKLRNYQTFRCKSCQKKQNRICMDSINKKRAGSVMNKINAKLVRKEDGAPDWEKELEEIKKLKKRTYKPFKGDYINTKLKESYKYKSNPAVIRDE